MMAFLNKGLEIRFATSAPRATSEQVTFKYAGGIVDFVKHLNATKEPLFPRSATSSEGRADGQEVEIAFQWNTGYNEGIHGFANGISTIEGGMHEEGFKTALTNGGQQVRPGQEPPQGEGPNLTGEDIREGSPPSSRCAARAAVRGPDQGQARQRPDAVARAEGHQREALAEWLEENPTEANKIVKKASPPPRPAWPPRTPATPSVARPRSTAPACPTS
jgi:DNA gyrase subunit B